MFHTTAKKLEVLEAQLACITGAVCALRQDLTRVADTRRNRCKTAYHKDISQTRVLRNAYYQRTKGKRGAKVSCDCCGRAVRSDYLRRHQKTSRCTPSVTKPSPTGSSDILQGQRPGQPSMGEFGSSCTRPPLKAGP